jgi:LmbE family N-acetylglucosaminyl deacetylase
MELTVDESHQGTPESVWRRSSRLRSMPPLHIGNPRRLIVIAPHPDDETLAAGGLMAVAARRGIPIEIVAVTDGEASHPATGIDLGVIRAQERHQALARLGVRPTIHRLGIADGVVAGDAERLVDGVGRILRAGDLCVAPWPRDGHPDHDACGAVALKLTSEVGCSLLQYLVWAWHWATPDSDEVPWIAGRRLALSLSVRLRKRWSIGAFQSQTTVSRAPGRIEPVLPRAVLARFQRPAEIFIAGGHP